MECMRLSAGDTQIFRCREVVRSSECPLLEVPLYWLFHAITFEQTKPTC